MGVPTSEVGYTSATTGRGDHEVHKGHVVALAKKVGIATLNAIIFGSGNVCFCVFLSLPSFVSSVLSAQRSSVCVFVHNKRHQFSHNFETHKTTGKIWSLCALIVKGIHTILDGIVSNFFYIYKNCNNLNDFIKPATETRQEYRGKYIQYRPRT
jgi:hypothetical protein